MRGSLTVALAGLLALAAAPLAIGQTHQHDASSGVVIAHDVPPDGSTFVGNINHFGIVVLGDDGVPDYHEQNHIRVTLNGVVLMETTPDSGHDYDGINLFDVSFPVAGHYTVEALGDDGKMLAMFNGTVHDAVGLGRLLPAGLKVDAPAAAVAGTPVTYTYSNVDDPTAASPTMHLHSDAWFEVWRGTDLVFRTKTHTHEEAQSLEYTFPEAGNYKVGILGFQAYPTQSAAWFAPVWWEHDIQVTPGLGTPPGLPPARPPTPFTPDPPMANKVVLGSGGPEYSLVGTYDPWSTVGPATHMRLNALVMDPTTRAPVQHVDFTASLKDALGRTLFYSETLHEYDGVYEFQAMMPVGLYTLTVEASRGDWTSTLVMPYTVAPPVLVVAPDVPPAVAVGPFYYSLDAVAGAQSGVPFTLDIAATNLANQPFAHSEIEYSIFGSDGYIAQIGKLHTHGDGHFELTLALEEGNYKILLSPFPLEPQPATSYHQCCEQLVGQAEHMGLGFSFKVGSGPGFPPAENLTFIQEPFGSNGISAAPLGFAVLALAVALVVRTKRGSP